MIPSNPLLAFAKKSFAVVAIVSFLLTAPLSARAIPLPILFLVVIPLTSAAIVDSISCTINVVWGCDDAPAAPAGGGGGGSSPDACSSGPNSCGMTNSGFIEGGSCNATPPPDSSCPAPVISQNDFFADPTKVREGESSTLTWDVQNATECTVTSDRGFNYSGGASGSVSSGPIPDTTMFTLTCQNGDGPSTSASLRVIIYTIIEV